MGIDIHVHDQYFVVAHFSAWWVVMIAALLVSFGAWKLANRSSIDTPGLLGTLGSWK